MDMKTKNSQIRFLFCLLIMSSSVLGLIIYTSLNTSISQSTRNEASNEQIYMFDNKRPEDTEEVSLTEKKINSESAASTFKSRNEHSASDFSHNKSNSHETITSDSDRKSNKLLKIYIYNLSSEFNEDISQCITSARLSPGFSRCFDYSNYGMGRLLYQEGGVSVLNTNQFSLDVILHHQLLHSKYRTDDPTKADIFYIPAYMGSLFFCQNGKFALSELTDMLFRYLNTMPYFAQGKPHVTSLSKIEREEVPVVLAHNSWINITYLAIEKDSDFFRTMLGIASLSVIVAPYPSYVHLNYTTDSSMHIDLLSAGERRTFLFLASSLRKSCELRAKIIEQFSVQTQEGFENFYKSENNSNVDQVLLVTVECMGDHHNKTIHWMQNSVFCLQPHGDSPTRKSFYDSILSGCIPVVFQFPEEKVEFPFQRILNYTEFTVHIPVDAKGNTENNSSVYDYLRSISLKTINTLQTNLKRVLHLFQYPLITKVRQGNQKDAVDMIVEEIQAKYKL